LRKETNGNTVETEIRQLEKALDAAIRRPQLIRLDYWIPQVECLP